MNESEIEFTKQNDTLPITFQKLQLSNVVIRTNHSEGGE